MIESLSEIVHNMWMKWAKILIDEEPLISEERKNRWKKCFVPYKMLSEEEKNIDREIVIAIMKCLEQKRE